MSGINGTNHKRSFKIKPERHDKLLSTESRFSLTLDQVNSINDKTMPGYKKWPDDLSGIKTKDYDDMQKDVAGF